MLRRRRRRGGRHVRLTRPPAVPSPDAPGYDGRMVLARLEPWHWWIGVVFTCSPSPSVLGLVVSYVNKVVRPSIRAVASVPRPDARRLRPPAAMTTTEPVDWAFAERVAVRLATRHADPVPARRTRHPTSSASASSPKPSSPPTPGSCRPTVRRGSGSSTGPAGSPPTSARSADCSRRCSSSSPRARRRRSGPGAGAGRQPARGRRRARPPAGLDERPRARPVRPPRRRRRRADQDIVYVVGPNLVALEHRFGFPPEEFRLWLALHELTHRAQFTGVPWMRGLLPRAGRRRTVAGEPRSRRAAPPAARRADRSRGHATATARGRTPGGVRIAGAARRAGSDGRPDGAARGARRRHDEPRRRRSRARRPSASAACCSARRRQTNLLQRLTGIEAKLDQYAAGERFIAAIEADGGPRAVDRCWAGPDALADDGGDPRPAALDRPQRRRDPDRLIVDAYRRALVDELLARCELPELSTAGPRRRDAGGRPARCPAAPTRSRCSCSCGPPDSR